MNKTIRTDPDAELITAAGKGDHQAFERLVQKHGTALLNFLLRYTGDRTVAEDIVQEVFIRIYTSAHTFKKTTGVKASTWIFKIAYNLSMNEIKRQRRYKRFCNALNQTGQQTQHLERIKEWETRKDIMAALRRLPEDQRAALLLRVNEGYSYREISNILNRSVSGVESLIFRGRKSLKKHLKF